MPDILLTHGYFLGEDEKEQQIMKPYPPLGLLYLSAYLRRIGLDVEVYDPTFRGQADLAERLAREPGGVVGIYTTLTTRRPVLETMAQAKRHGWTVVLGGPESANYPAEYLAHGADVVVTGEGEETLAELLPALGERGPHRLQGLAGTTFRNEDGQVIINPERPQIADLDRLPWPDREQINQPQYLDLWRQHHGLSSMNLITARGCPYQCKWCSHAVFGYTHRRRSFKDCADELQFIQETYHPDQVWYADDVFTLHHPWLFNYATELRRRHLKLPFETISRPDRMRSEEVLETLAKMGCYRLWIGCESGSQRILDAMQRDVTVEQVQWVAHTARRYGIQVGLFLMWGYDGETVEDIQATIEQVKQTNPDLFFTTVAYPIKNTPFYRDNADRIVLPQDWAKATDRDHRIQGRHSRTYYRYADQWLRHEVDAFRLAAEDPAEAELKRSRAASARAALQAASREVEA